MSVLNAHDLTPWVMGLFAVLVVTSCAPVSRDSLEKQVLEADPKFALVLDKRRELNNQIQTLKRALGLKRTTTEDTVIELRRDLAEATNNVRKKIAEIKKQIIPEQELIELKLSITSEKLKSLRAQRSSLGRSISQLQKALKQEESLMQAQERRSKQIELNTMLIQVDKLDQELDRAKEQVRLVKMKMLIIKL